MGTLYIWRRNRPSSRKLDNGEVLLEPAHRGVLARIILVLLVGGDCRHTCVEEESSTDELHEEEGVHQVLPREDEDESEYNCADDSR